MMINGQRLIDAMRLKLATKKPTLIRGDYRQAAVLVPVVVGQSEPCILLTQRAQHLQLHPGESAFPGGKPEPLDEDLLATAFREAKEEVNLCEIDSDYLGPLDQQLTRSHFVVSPYVSVIADSIPLTANQNEIGEIYTVPFSYLADPNNLQAVEQDYQGVMKTVPCYHYQGYEIWGVTANIIVDLINTVSDASLAIELKR